MGLKRATEVIGCSLLLLLSPFIAFAADFTNIFKKVSPAVVVIEGTLDGGRAGGSGFIVSTDGKIATNVHVLQGLKDAQVVLASGTKFDRFSVIAFDELRDLVIIKIPGFSLPTVRLGDSDKVVPGQEIAAIGNPRGLTQSVTSGIVSGIRDDPNGAAHKLIQIDAALNPGNSGGPIVNSRGDVIGIAVGKLKGAEALNFAIPVSYLKGLIADVQAALTLEEFQATLRKSTTRTAAIPPATPAAAPTQVASTPSSFPERWKSLSSGAIFRVKRLLDKLIIEKEIPVEERQYGERITGELSGQDYRTFSGSANGSSYCVSPEAQRLCPISIHYTLNIISPERIEVTASGPTGGDCATCAVEQTNTSHFSWIPASPDDRTPGWIESQLASVRSAQRQRQAACEAALKQQQIMCSSSNPYNTSLPFGNSSPTVLSYQACASARNAVQANCY